MKNRKPHAFTLIELLVVLAIIALLVALLMPALSKARGAARAVMCQSNLRQVAIGVEAYTTDNRGDFLGIYTPPSGNIWYFALQRGNYWAAIKRITTKCVDNRYTTHTYDNVAVMECPGDEPQTFMNVSSQYYSGVPYNSFTHHYVRSSYDLNFDIGDTLDAFWWYGGYDGTSHRFTTLTYRGATPANSPLVMDNRLYDGIYNALPAFYWGVSAGQFYTDTGDWYDITGDPALMHAFRHPNNTANVVFIDSHVEARQPYCMTGKTRLYRNVWKGVNDHGTPY